MKSKVSFLSIITLVIIFASCQNKIKWEYKTVYYDAEKIEAADKSYAKGSKFSSTISPIKLCSSLDAKENIVAIFKGLSFHFCKLFNSS